MQNSWVSAPVCVLTRCWWGAAGTGPPTPWCSCCRYGPAGTGVPRSWCSCCWWGAGGTGAPTPWCSCYWCSLLHPAFPLIVAPVAGGVLVEPGLPRLGAPVTGVPCCIRRSRSSLLLLLVFLLASGILTRRYCWQLVGPQMCTRVTGTGNGGLPGFLTRRRSLSLRPPLVSTFAQPGARVAGGVWPDPAFPGPDARVAGGVLVEPAFPPIVAPDAGVPLYIRHSHSSILLAISVTPVVHACNRDWERRVARLFARVGDPCRWGLRWNRRSLNLAPVLPAKSGRTRRSHALMPVLLVGSGWNRGSHALVLLLLVFLGASGIPTRRYCWQLV